MGLQTEDKKGILPTGLAAEITKLSEDDLEAAEEVDNNTFNFIMRDPEIFTFFCLYIILLRNLWDASSKCGPLAFQFAYISGY